MYFGPVAQTCLRIINIKNNGIYAKRLENYLGEVDEQISNFVANCGHESLECTVYSEVSHKIGIIKLLKTGFFYIARIIAR